MPLTEEIKRHLHGTVLVDKWSQRGRITDGGTAMKRVLIAFPLLALLTVPAAADLGKGVTAYQRGDYVVAHGEFLASARAGEAQAKFSLGLMYLRGQGVAKDLPEALRWLRDAAGQGDGDARMVLGDLHMKDDPAVRDLAKSYLWLTLALSKVRGKKRHRTFDMRRRVTEMMAPKEREKAKRMVEQWRASSSTK